MSLSGYKVETLLNAFRKKYGYKRVSDHRIDSLRISEEAKYEGNRLRSFIEHSKPAPEWVTPQNILELIADRTEYDTLTEYEQQRRAGLFLEPMYIPPNPPPPINLVREFTVVHETEAGMERVSPVQTESTSAKMDTTRATATSAITPSPEKTTPVAGLEIEEEEDFNLSSEEADGKQDDEADVVYGLGRITEASMMDFIHKHPDSALKFLASRELDGKHLSSGVLDVYDGWKQRGLSRKKVLNYILEIMEWDALPNEPLYDIWSRLRDKIYDLLH